MGTARLNDLRVPAVVDEASPGLSYGCPICRGLINREGSVKDSDGKLGKLEELMMRICLAQRSPGSYITDPEVLPLDSLLLCKIKKLELLKLIKEQVNFAISSDSSSASSTSSTVPQKISRNFIYLPN